MAIIKEKVVERKEGYIYYIDGAGNLCEAKMTTDSNEKRKSIKT